MAFIKRSFRQTCLNKAPAMSGAFASDFHIVASVENLAAVCEKSKRPQKPTIMHIVNGGPLHDISSSRRSSSLSFTGVRKFCIPYVTLDTGRWCCGQLRGLGLVPTRVGSR